MTETSESRTETTEESIADSGDAARTIWIALACNAAITAAKFVGFAFTGSASMLAEAIHSVADTANQGILLAGERTGKAWLSKLAAVVIFSLGLLILSEGWERLRHPEPITSLGWAFGILAVSVALETVSITKAIASIRAAGGVKAEPELLVLLVEDSAALAGLALAVAGVSTAALTGSPVWDALGSIAIGVLEALSGLGLFIKLIREA